MSTIQRRAAMCLAAVATVQACLGWVGSAGAAEGQITNIGGNGPTNCFLTAEYLLATKPEDRPKPTSISGGGFTTSRGMQGIASDIYGQRLYLAAGGQIFDRTSTVAGTSDLNGRLDDGAPGKLAAFPRMVDIAIDPFGKSLWVLENARSGDVPFTGRVRRIDLTTSTLPVTTVIATGPNPTGIAADSLGNLYITEKEVDLLYAVSPSGAKTVLSSVTGPTAVAVDVTGSEIFVSNADRVYRLSRGTSTIVAGPTIARADGASPVITPISLAIGHETDGQSIAARYLYIGDQKESVVRVDLKASPNIVTTVAGGGSSTESADDGRSVKVKPHALAADIAGHVYIADGDNCRIWQLQTPAPFRLPTEPTVPPNGPTNTTQPPDSSKPTDNNDTVADVVGNGQGNTGTVPQQAPAENGAQIGSNQSASLQPQTEIRILDPGNALTAPQPAPQPVPTPAATAQPAPAPTPTPAAEAGTTVIADPGTSTAGVAAETSPVVPAAPATAPVPPAPASSPVPAAPQPVSNVGLAHGDSAAPARGATRYAMVRNDDDASAASLAAAGAGGLLAMFLCVLFVAPGTSSKPKPRPKGAY